MQGGWCLPDISSQVPHVLSNVEALAPRNAAKLALCSSSLGLELPHGRFTSPIDSLRKQWKSYIATQGGEANPLKLDVYVLAEEEKLKFIVEATSAIPCFKLKPVVTALNKAQPGLGWFVFDVITLISGTGFPVYQIGDLASFAEYIWHNGACTDDEYLDQLREEYPMPVSDEYIRSQHPHAWPSDMEEAVDGHAWMLNRYHLRAGNKRPAKATISDARRFTENRRSPRELVSVVRAALQLRRYLKSKSAAELTLGRSEEDQEWDEGYAPDRLGASCILVWDKHQVLLDALSHWEEFQMNGESTMTHHYFEAPASDDEALADLVSQFKRLVRLYALAGELLRHFPTLR